MWRVTLKNLTVAENDKSITLLKLSNGQSSSVITSSVIWRTILQIEESPPIRGDRKPNNDNLFIIAVFSFRPHSFDLPFF